MSSILIARTISVVACGAASRLRLKRLVRSEHPSRVVSRMWSGFSSEIETPCPRLWHVPLRGVACGAASRLRLKHRQFYNRSCYNRYVACGAASRLRLKHLGDDYSVAWHYVACGAASRLRLKPEEISCLLTERATSHVERLLV